MLKYIIVVMAMVFALSACSGPQIDWSENIEMNHTNIGLVSDKVDALIEYTELLETEIEEYHSEIVFTEMRRLMLFKSMMLSLDFGAERESVRVQIVALMEDDNYLSASWANVVDNELHIVAFIDILWMRAFNELMNILSPAEKGIS